MRLVPVRGKTLNRVIPGGRKRGRDKEVEEVGVPGEQSAFPHLLSLKPNRD